MPTAIELALVAAAVADPAQRWAALTRPPSPETFVRVSLAHDFFDDPLYLTQNPPEAAMATRTTYNPASELDLEEVEEDPEDLEEYLAMEEEDHSQTLDNPSGDFDGLDILDTKTSAGKDGDAPTTKRVYARINRSYGHFLSELSSLPVSGVSKDIYLPDKDDYVNRHLVRIFLTWYIKKTSPTSTHVSEALMFLQRKLTDSMNALGCIARKGAIREDTWIKTFTKDMLIKVASSEAALLRDLHADMDRQISRTDQLRLVDCCYDPLVLSTLCDIAKSNVVTGYVLSSQVGSHGSDSHGMMISHGFVKKMQYLGDGEDVDHLVHNHGKTNRVGRVTYKAFATHRNPRMDSSAHLGLSALLRYSCLGEPFPNFLKPKDYARRFLFRSSMCYLKGYPSSTQYSNWKKVFKHCDIFCHKVTHVCRGQIQQELSDKGVCAQDHERFFGYAASREKKMNSNQKDSYLFTPPVAPVCGAADGDPKNPSFHKPAWCIELAPNELHDLCPWLYTQLQVVQDAFDLHPTFKARKVLCLFQASSCLLSMERRISQAVKMLASLPVDEKNNLNSECVSIHERWSSFAVCRLPYSLTFVAGSTKHKWMRL